MVDTEKDEVILYSRDWRYLGLKKRRVEEHQEIKPSFRDINPIPVMIVIFKKPTNAIVLLSSSKSLFFLMVRDIDVRYIICCSVYCYLYCCYYSCCVRRPLPKGVTLISSSPYNYNPLIIGVVILSFGAGNMVGSVAGGKWSDVYLRRLREANNGVSVPEVCSLLLPSHMRPAGEDALDEERADL